MRGERINAYEAPRSAKGGNIDQTSERTGWTLGAEARSGVLNSGTHILQRQTKTEPMSRFPHQNKNKATLAMDTGGSGKSELDRHAL